MGEIKRGEEIPLPKGKLGIMLVGLGAVSTTFVAGVEAIKRGKGLPIGSLTQMGRIRLGKRTEGRFPLIKEVVSLYSLEDLVFSAWDIFPDNAYEAAKKAQVLEPALIEDLKEPLSNLEPMPGVFDQNYVKRLTGTHIKRIENKYEQAESIREDIREFKKKVDKVVMIWCASTEAYKQPERVHNDLESFEKGLKENHPDIAPSMIYAYASLMEGVPYINGAPNLSVDIKALVSLSEERKVPIAGKDFKTGQTLMKTIIAPGLKARVLGLSGWFSTNILGNRDGEVLDDPESFRTKEESKLGVLETILQPHLYPELYGNYYHKVRINFYPPRGDNKEGWDNIDIFGWLGYPMQIKIDFLCRDSILAAPLVLDLVLFIELAQRVQMYGIQEWLSFYFKSPMVKEGLYPEHDLFIQLMKLKNTIRYIAGEELITHLGLDYYYENI